MKLRDSFIQKLFSIKGLAFILLVVYISIRLPYLGFSNFNTDSFKWKQRIYDFGSGVFNLDFEKTNQKYHPGVTLLWIGTASVKAHTLVHEYFLGEMPEDNTSDLIFSLNFYQILFLVISSSLLILLLFFNLTKIFSPIKSFLILLIVSTEPFLLGLTTTLHLDGLLSLFLINSLVYFYLYLILSRKNYLYFSGLVFGLALLTKTTSLLFLPIFAVVYLYYKRFNLSIVVPDAVKFILIVVATYFIVWPAMWVNPVGTIETVYKGLVVGSDDHSQIYFGNLVGDPGPLFYLLVFLIKTPIYIFPALLLALHRQFGTTYSKYSFDFILLLSSVLYLIEITIPSKKLDRYILPSIVLISVFCLSYLYDKYKEKIVLLLFLNFGYAFYINFDYFSYYNPLIGGISNFAYSVEPKWAFGQKEFTSYFKEIAIRDNLEYFPKNQSDVSRVREKNNRLIVALPEKYFTQLNPYLRYLDGVGVINEIKPDAARANYFVFPVWEDNSYEFIERYNLELDQSIYIRGVETYKVYKRNKE